MLIYTHVYNITLDQLPSIYYTIMYNFYTAIFHYLYTESPCTCVRKDMITVWALICHIFFNFRANDTESFFNDGDIHFKKKIGSFLMSRSDFGQVFENSRISQLMTCLMSTWYRDCTHMGLEMREIASASVH